MRVLNLHMHMDPVRRSRGGSAVRSAAYIAGEKLYDERTGLYHDYSDRAGVEYTGIALSEDAPEKATDRSWLWNSAEARENRDNSRPAYRFIVNKPAEFDERLRRESDLRIARLLADRFGAADYAGHLPDDKGDNRNFHSHFLTPTRKFENGQWAAKKHRLLTDRKTGPEELKRLRREIAGIMNEICVREKLPLYVEYLSFEARGLELEPTKHMGQAASQMERRGVVTDIGDYNREAMGRNEQRQALWEERRVVDFELAKADLRRRHAAKLLAQEPYQAFYRDTYDRHKLMLDEQEKKDGGQQARLQEEAVRLTQSLQEARGLKGIWRKITGRIKNEKDQLAEVSEKLTAIDKAHRDRAAAFERDRLQRLEALKAEQQQLRQDCDRQQQQWEQQQEAMARAVGENQRPTPQPEARRAWTQVAEPQETRRGQPEILSPAKDDNQQDARREYFRRAAIRKKQIEAEARVQESDKASGQVGEIAQEFKQTAEPSATDSPALTPKQIEYQKRLEAFQRRSRSRKQTRDREDGPEREL